MTLKIVYQPPKNLTMNARNSRTHTPEQIAKVAEAIKEYGFINPVVVADKEIIAGHARVQAALICNLRTVPTIDVGYLSETQRRAYIIADNKLAEESGWDQNILREELSFLKGLEFSLNLTGFDEDQLRALGVEDAYKPVLNPEKGSAAVTTSEVDKEAARLAGQYSEAGKQEFVTCTCPHCGEDFDLQKGTI